MPDAGSQAMLHTLQLAFSTLRWAIVVLLFIYVLSGLFVVGPAESAFILRFGAPVGSTGGGQLIESGHWHWAWPKPIDKIIRVPTKETRTIVTDQFWHDERLSEESERSAGSSGVSDFSISEVEGYNVTGDKNILHSRWSLSYSISDPIKYFSEYTDPEDLIRTTFEATILREMAATRIDQALYGGTEALRLSVHGNLKVALADINAGVLIKNVTIERIEPPRSTRGSFQNVTRMEHEKSKKINAARGYTAKVVQETDGYCAEILALAEGYRKRIVASVHADAVYFQAILEKYQRDPKTTLMTLHTDVLTEVLKKVDRKFVIHTDEDGGGQEVRLLIGSERELRTLPFR